LQRRYGERVQMQYVERSPQGVRMHFRVVAPAS
jgi:hypothetical protein